MFHEVEGAVAIVRKPKGVFVQVKCYHRRGAIYVAAAGGFVRVADKFGERYGTSHPNLYVEEFVAPGNIRLDGNKAPTYA